MQVKKDNIRQKKIKKINLSERLQKHSEWPNQQPESVTNQDRKVHKPKTFGHWLQMVFSQVLNLLYAYILVC